MLSTCLLVMCICRSPSGDFCYFIKQLELVLNKLYKVSTNTVLRGDFNINFLEKSSRVILLESLLASFSLDSTVKFPTRNVNNSHTLIDNIFIDKNRFYSLVHPLINPLNMKCRPLYLKTQFVPHSKHFSSLL